MRSFITLLFLSIVQINFVLAQVEFRTFKNTEQERQYNVLIDELRCLVCQNQNLKDSNSDLAKDMRNKVFSMLSDGKNKNDIVEHMVERYGDFVLYKPPFKSITLLLWIGPLLFFVIAFVSVVRIVKSRNQDEVTTELSEAEHQRAEALLNPSDKNKDKTA